jgi:hypothetical protein
MSIVTLTKHAPNVDGAAASAAIGAGAPEVQFRSRPLPTGMTLPMAVEAERLITEWELSSDQPDQLASALFQVFAGLAIPRSAASEGLVLGGTGLIVL